MAIDINNFKFSLSDVDETGLVIVSVTDIRTAYTVRTALPHAGLQTASIMAFAGARFSRSDLSAVDLFKEIKSSGKSASIKLANIFKNYGHSSVADMAMLFAYIENIPKLYAVKLFYETSIGAGQERSSRYQDYSKSPPISLDNYITKDKTFINNYQQIAEHFQRLQEQALGNYRKYKEILTAEYADLYGVDQQDKSQLGALQARVFDSARYFLPSGVATKSSLAYITSAREWARLISILKASKDIHLNYLGEQLEILFAPESSLAESLNYVPEAPDLIRYTQADETTSNNLASLTDYLEEKWQFSTIIVERSRFGFNDIDAELLPSSVTSGVKILLQNIVAIYPLVKITWLMEWIKSRSVEELESLSEILFAGYNHHLQMGNQFKVNTNTFIVTSSIAEALDLNRHRAWGRFIPLLAMEQDYSQMFTEGYTLPAYLTENENLVAIREAFENDLLSYYDNLKLFFEEVAELTWFPNHLLLQLLPLGHIMKIWLHGSPKEISYLTKLRVRPGGHINYRIIAYKMAQLAAGSEPLLAGLGMFEKKPDATSKLEFLDRS